MKHIIAIETLQLVEINADSEEEAIQIVKDQLDAQDPRNTASLKIVKEVEI